MGFTLLALLLSHPDLDEGRVAFSSMKYRAAVPVLVKVTQDKAATEAEVQEALTLLARAHLALKSPEAAQADFEALLRRAPMTEEPTGNPALRATFQQAKAAVFPPGTVRLVRRASSEDTLLVDVVNPWRLEVVATWHQVEPSVVSRVLLLERQQVATSLAAGAAGYLELTKDGQVVAALGSRAEPLRGPASPPPAPVVADAPKSEPAPPLTPAATAPAPDLTPGPAAAPPSNSRRVAGWTLIGVGLATGAAGAGVIAWGAEDRRIGDGFPITIQDLFEAQRLIIQGETKMVGGGIMSGVGLTAAVIGLILLLTE